MGNISFKQYQIKGIAAIRADINSWKLLEKTDLKLCEKNVEDTMIQKNAYRFYE